MGNDLVPVEKVLDDMYSDSFISSSARKYYYLNYATYDEKTEMDFEDKIQGVLCWIFSALLLIGLVAGVIYG